MVRNISTKKSTPATNPTASTGSPTVVRVITVNAVAPIGTAALPRLAKMETTTIRTYWERVKSIPNAFAAKIATIAGKIPPQASIFMTAPKGPTKFATRSLTLSRPFIVLMVMVKEPRLERLEKARRRAGLAARKNFRGLIFAAAATKPPYTSPI